MLVAWKVWFSFPNITLVALTPSLPFVPLVPLLPSVPSINLAIVLTSDEPSLAVTLKETELIELVYKGEELEIVKTRLLIVNPFNPLVTSVQEEPPLVLYCHLLNVQLVNSGVSFIVEGE